MNITRKALRGNTPMKYTARAFVKHGVPFEWYYSGGGHEHLIVAPDFDNWYDTPHLMTGHFDGCLFFMENWDYEDFTQLHHGFGYEWEELTPERMERIAEEVAYTAKGWLLSAKAVTRA